MATAGPVKLKNGEILFKENDPSDAMYVIKSGRIAIVKAKGTSEIVLAELGPGQMLGEMAFFDNRNRSAGARAIGQTEVICLPFLSLYAQFKTFPEWLKAMVKTVNNHLREANQKIKNLETSNQDDSLFTPHTITRLLAILVMVSSKFGEATEEGLRLNSTLLRDFTIQIFQTATHKMTRFTEILAQLGYLKLEKNDTGSFQVTVLKEAALSELLIFYNTWLFKPDDKKTFIDEKDIRPLKTLVFYGQQQSPDKNGHVKLDLTEIQNNSMRDLNYVAPVEMYDQIIDKKIVGEKFTQNDHIFVEFELESVEKLARNWELIYTLLKQAS